MYKILFVCLGNICRSPMAQTIMQEYVEKRGVAEHFEIDSAGIIDYHEGESADGRMRNFAYQRGYFITHRSRPISKDDFRHFDYIIGMDNDNIRALEQLAPADSIAQIQLITKFCTRHSDDVVPDPYYGGAAGFSLVIDLLEDACEGMLNTMNV